MSPTYRKIYISKKFTERDLHQWIAKEIISQSGKMSEVAASKLKKIMADYGNNVYP